MGWKRRGPIIPYRFLDFPACRADFAFVQGKQVGTQCPSPRVLRKQRGSLGGGDWMEVGVSVMSHGLRYYCLFLKSLFVLVLFCIPYMVICLYC